MVTRSSKCALALLLAVVACSSKAQNANPGASPAASYIGFDRNDYPGAAALPALRKSFRYTAYWLNPPPGESLNSWTGKRAILRNLGFGFLVLFSGRIDAELKAAAANGSDVSALGAADGKAAAAAAKREGFSPNVLIFLDQEEGGRLLPEQAAYLFAWIDAVQSVGARAGVYCSAIAVPDGNGTITTAQDIAERESTRTQSNHSSKIASRVALWVANDQCPPSPGCTPAHLPVNAAVSPALASSVVAWQYAQSPRRRQFSAACPVNQARDGNCYAPGLPSGANIFVDLDSARSPDPSESPNNAPNANADVNHPR